jgi:Zierdtviridae exonuclease
VETWRAYVGDTIEFIKTRDATEEDVAIYDDALGLGEAMLEGYIAKYGKDEHKLYISAEQTFSIDIPWPERDDIFKRVKRIVMARYAGTFDGVWRHADTGLIWLDEHKTAKSIVLTHLPMDSQGGTYWTMARRVLTAKKIIKPSDRFAGIEYNFLRKARPDERPTDAEGYATNKPLKADYLIAIEQHLSRTTGLAQGVVAGELARIGKLTLAGLEQLAAANKLTVTGERSKVQPAPLFLRHQVHRTSRQNSEQLQRIQDEAWTMELARRGATPLLLNPTRDCHWDCRFYEMCELKQNGGNWEDFRDLKYRQEDPYADHRKSTDE